MSARGSACASLALVFLATASASAEVIDGSHGRIEGDVAVAAAAGVTVAARGPRATGDLRLRYLSTAGLYATYEDGPLLGSDAEPKRLVAFGVEVRPLFLPRWLSGKSTENARLDLAIDSIALELGTFFAQPNGKSLGEKPGIAFGLGFELPVFPRATGPLVGFHGGARFGDRAIAGGPIEGASDRALYLAIVVGWQHVFASGIVGDGGT